MVHTRCKFGKDKGRTTTEFYIDGKPQTYCFGIIDGANDDYLKECVTCPEWVYGEQSDEDYRKAFEEGRITDKHGRQVQREVE